MRRDDLFRPIDPPPGGLTRLRERIERDEARSRCHLVAWLAPAAAGAATAALLLLLGRGADLREAIPTSASAIALGLKVAGPLEIPAQERGRVAALRVPTADPNVLLYRIEAMEAQ